jgi:hypothetical protein
VIVIYGLAGLLDEVGEVCACHLGRVLRLESLEELLLDFPVVQVDIILFSEHK